MSDISRRWITTFELLHTQENDINMENEYLQLLDTIKATIREERTKAIRQLNRSLITESIGK